MRNYTDDNFKPNLKDKDLFKRLIAYALPYKYSFLIVLLIMAAAVFLELIPPLLVGNVVNILEKPEVFFDNYNLILYNVIIYFTILVVGSIFNYIQVMILQITGQKILFNIRSDVFMHIETLSIGQINQVPIGKLVTRVINDTNTLNQMYTDIIVNLLKNALTIIGVTIAMFIVNYQIALFIMCVVPFVVFFSFIFRKFSRDAHRKVRRNLSNINAFLSENLSLMKIIQAMNQQRKQYNEFNDRNSELKRSYIKEIIIFGIFRPSIYLLNIIATMLILYFGSILVLNAEVELGLISTFTLYLGLFFNPIQQLSEQYNVIQSSFAAAERIIDVIDTKPSVISKKDALKVEKLTGEIEFKNVYFAYEGENWILKDVSFKVNAGETVAFVGATGSGKTTILGLIVRNYDIQKGQILIDGIDIQEIEIDSLRKNIGQMLQDVFLFSGTINSNIRLRDNSISNQEIVDAAKYVNANHFIEKLDNGYETLVKERGNNFSSGQRQLLSFARVIAHKPSIMILDEATSNIDTETEQIIQQSLAKMMNIGTMLIVAHRLSTIQHANKIILLSNGEIKEVGNHQELLRKKGMYYNLYKLQYE